MYPSLWNLPGDLFADVEALQRQMERLLGTRSATSSIRAVERGSFPPVNIGSTPEAIEIYAFAPGIEPAKVELSVEKGLLIVNTGPGKGKSTAAFGLILRADCSRNWPTRHFSRKRISTWASSPGRTALISILLGCMSR